MVSILLNPYYKKHYLFNFSNHGEIGCLQCLLHRPSDSLPQILAHFLQLRPGHLRLEVLVVNQRLDPRHVIHVRGKHLSREKKSVSRADMLYYQ